MSKLRWGILGTANIALSKVIPAMQKSAMLEVTAIASRDLGRARTAAERLRIPNAFGSYEQLLASGDVDVVYNPLPNHLHVPWSLKAIEAGKHVLCEKPVGLSAEEGEALLAAARAHPELKVMEAFMYRFHPQWQAVKAIVDGGGIGELRTIQSFFSYFKLDPDNIRNRADIGGGGLMDIGCYNISLSRYLYDAEPLRVVATVELDPELRVDRLSSAILDFGRGTSTFTCSTQLAPHQSVDVFGTEGRVSLEIPFNAPQDGPTRLRHMRGGETVERVFDRVDQYTLQAEAFTRAIREDREVPTPLDDAVANMRVIEAVFGSGRSGGWVELTAAG
ncbi:MAG TPA: Gfo/Idh/MocA family oxidoreductase [Trueperaceae bacterium]|nr:Gfo/Idh/MocA family oxidoreductase [Trueperaceae bacterium]